MFSAVIVCRIAVLSATATPTCCLQGYYSVCRPRSQARDCKNLENSESGSQFWRCGSVLFFVCSAYVAQIWHRMA
ncbi:hypothetical protein CSR02_00455 [Acetobacter pomorum]|uniref:Secreted protein n=1 Tax=Acetobacter pomorum TaxID=65959 RepID=A0A2G4RFX8_9PROT|nr:hypothetical protein CSR02_00455 [Acetobacter pomorum]